jgi:hypothetical protein
MVTADAMWERAITPVPGVQPRRRSCYWRQLGVVVGGWGASRRSPCLPHQGSSRSHGGQLQDMAMVGSRRERMRWGLGCRSPEPFPV